MPLLDRPALSTDESRVLLAETRQDPLLHAAASLMLLVGARPMEAIAASVGDFTPGAEPRLRLGRRDIRMAPSAARAVEGYLATQVTAEEEPLLLGLQEVGTLPRLLRAAAGRAGVEAGVHSLRRAAIGAALEDGAPPRHLEAYFGIDKALDRKALVPLPDKYDLAMARTLEAAFGG